MGTEARPHVGGGGELVEPDGVVVAPVAHEAAPILGVLGTMHAHVHVFVVKPGDFELAEFVAHHHARTPCQAAHLRARRRNGGHRATLPRVPVDHACSCGWPRAQAHDGTYGDAEQLQGAERPAALARDAFTLAKGGVVTIRIEGNGERVGLDRGLDDARPDVGRVDAALLLGDQLVGERLSREREGLIGQMGFLVLAGAVALHALGSERRSGQEEVVKDLHAEIEG